MDLSASLGAIAVQILNFSCSFWDPVCLGKGSGRSPFHQVPQMIAKFATMSKIKRMEGHPDDRKSLP